MSQCDAVEQNSNAIIDHIKSNTVFKIQMNNHSILFSTDEDLICVQFWATEINNNVDKLQKIDNIIRAALLDENKDQSSLASCF